MSPQPVRARGGHGTRASRGRRWTMHNHLREQVRQQVEGRNSQPTAALVDSQSLRGAETVRRWSQCVMIIVMIRRLARHQNP
ncbi:hypothetical protein [Micromonospora sp. DH14]|uniref:hypothetical protein n=1 Tax=Micromonospora sp. DH14 TaxID=3040120 RepID=UPI002442E278|nr:hypothetical protein [Micromonospora sp. DH14]MDG9675292.1 hypothetical protein [Micromonospora sp. DH14]